MTESDRATPRETQPLPKHALRRNLLGRPLGGRQPVRALVARYRAAGEE